MHAFAQLLLLIGQKTGGQLFAANFQYKIRHMLSPCSLAENLNCEKRAYDPCTPELSMGYSIFLRCS